MFVINGEKTFAKVVATPADIEQTALDQIKNICDHPAFKDSNITIMPDAHGGTGCVIGFTCKVKDYIVPNLIGVDIGCGVLTYKISKCDIPLIDLKKLDEFIHKNIPHGFSIRKNPHKFANFFKDDFYNIKDCSFRQFCEQIGTNERDVLSSVGSLGSGNHFQELSEDEKFYYFTVHCGSRNFGLRVCNYYQKIAKEKCKMYFFDKFDKCEFLPMCDGGIDYLKSMKSAQRLAHWNRRAIISDVVEYLGLAYNEENLIESVHNYIDDDNILRKGAISAKPGEKVVIPLNMRDGIILGTGKSKYEYNFSAPHGAGRTMSRTKAKASISLESFQKSMECVFSTCINESTIDESPFAYKPKETIINNIGELVEIEQIIKPIYNFKAN